MKNLTKKEFDQELTNTFIENQFSAYLLKHPNQRTDAALYTAGRLQSLLVSAMAEIPNHTYKEIVHQLKG